MGKLSPYETADEEQMFSKGYDAGFEDGKGEALPLLIQLIDTLVHDDPYYPFNDPFCEVCEDYAPHHLDCLMIQAVEYVMNVYQWFEVGGMAISQRLIDETHVPDAVPYLNTLEPFPPAQGWPTPDTTK